MEEQEKPQRRMLLISILVAMLFFGIVLVLMAGFIRQRGGEDVATIVQEAVKNQRLATDGGYKVVADKMLVVFRQGATGEQKDAVARTNNVKIVGKVVGEADTYVVEFVARTGRELRVLSERLRQSVDVVDARLISAE